MKRVHTLYTGLGNAKLAEMLLDHAIHEEDSDGGSTVMYRDGLGNRQSGDRKVKITLTVEDA